MLIAGAVIAVGLNACTKQDYAPVPQTVPQPTQQQTKVEMVATEWNVQADGIYVSTFQNALSNLLRPSGSRLSVFAIGDDGPVLISGAPVIFMGHELWAATNREDVIVNYNCPEGPMPFQTLHIEVVAN